MSSICYDINRNQAADLFPCDPNGDIKSCCPDNTWCAGNGLCETMQDNTRVPYYIKGCTLQDWDDPTCPRDCLDAGLRSCNDDGWYCCDRGSGCNCDEDELFSLGLVEHIGTIFSGETQVEPATSMTSAITSTSTIPTTTSAPLSESTFSESTSSESTFSETISSANAPTDNSSSNIDSGSSGGDDNSLAVGLGVGLGVGSPLIAIAAGLFWFFKRKRTGAAAAQEMGTEGPKQAPEKSLYAATTPSTQGVSSGELDGTTRPYELNA